MEKNQAQGQTPEQSAQEYNQLVAVRRQKLADLQQAGNDPFVLTKYPVDNYAGALKKNLAIWSRNRKLVRLFALLAV